MVINYDAELSKEVEIRPTSLFSVVCLKSDSATATVTTSSAEGKEKKSEQANGKGKEDEDDMDGMFDDDDLFGGDGGDADAAAALKAKLEEAKKKKEKEKAKARSLIVLEVKPYEADFDLEELAQSIKKMEHEGVQNWGLEHKLVPIAFGIKKLQISAVVYDDLCGVDELSEMIMEQHEDDIQSIDVQAMSKV